jgi:hypothetical protein
MCELIMFSKTDVNTVILKLHVEIVQ